MKQRCNNPKHTAARWYHDKGIMVCEEWLDYKNFEKWALENGYADNLTIDRINSNGNYEPSNCHWITLKENSQKAIRKTAHNFTKNKYRKLNGRFMIVESTGYFGLFSVIQTGLYKSEALSQARILSDFNNKYYYVRVSDNHKIGDFCFDLEMNQYISGTKRKESEEIKKETAS